MLLQSCCLHLLGLQLWQMLTQLPCPLWSHSGFRWPVVKLDWFCLDVWPSWPFPRPTSGTSATPLVPDILPLTLELIPLLLWEGLVSVTFMLCSITQFLQPPFGFPPPASSSMASAASWLALPPLPYYVAPIVHKLSWLAFICKIVCLPIGSKRKDLLYFSQ